MYGAQSVSNRGGAAGKFCFREGYEVVQGPMALSRRLVFGVVKMTGKPKACTFGNERVALPKKPGG